MARFLGTPKAQYFQTGTADFLVGGKIYSYIAGTTTPTPTYPSINDALAGTNPNTNPVILDARGEANIVISGATKIILKDANDNTIWTADNIEAQSQNIIDSNGNEILKFTEVANAVNEVTITNAVSSAPPIVASTGGDSSVGLKVTSKASGKLFLDGGSTGTIELGTTSTGAINLKRAVTCSTTLSVTGTSTLTGTCTLAGSVTVTSSSTTFNDPVVINDSLDVTGTATLGSLIVAGTTNFVPAGTIVAYAGSSVPTGWYLCNGAPFSRTVYTTLFAAIGTVWGAGDGSTTFNIPNFARRTLVGSGGSGTGTLGSTTGSLGGLETTTIATLNLPPGTVKATAGTVVSSGVTAGAAPSIQGSGFTDSGTGQTVMNNIQPSAVITYIIRLV